MNWQAEALQTAIKKKNVWGHNWKKVDGCQINRILSCFTQTWQMASIRRGCPGGGNIRYFVLHSFDYISNCERQRADWRSTAFKWWKVDDCQLFFPRYLMGWEWFSVRCLLLSLSENAELFRSRRSDSLYCERCQPNGPSKIMIQQISRTPSPELGDCSVPRGALFSSGEIPGNDSVWVFLLFEPRLTEHSALSCAARNKRQTFILAAFLSYHDVQLFRDWIWRNGKRLRLKSKEGLWWYCRHYQR